MIHKSIIFDRISATQISGNCEFAISDDYYPLERSLISVGVRGGSCLVSRFLIHVFSFQSKRNFYFFPPQLSGATYQTFLVTWLVFCTKHTGPSGSRKKVSARTGLRAQSRHSHKNLIPVTLRQCHGPVADSAQVMIKNLLASERGRDHVNTPRSGLQPGQY